MHKIVKSTTLISLVTLLSRSLGFARDIVMAGLFGATPGFDAFLVAFKIPNFMRALFAEGSFSQAFVPMLMEIETTSNRQDSLDFIAKVLGRLLQLLLLITILLEILAPLVVLIFAPGFWDDPIRYQMAVTMLHLTLPYILLICITAFLGAVLNCYYHFLAPSLAPILLNLVLIIAGNYLAPRWQVGESALAFGVLLAGVVQCLFLLPFIIRYKLFTWPKRDGSDLRVRRLFKKLIPALFGVSGMQIAFLIDTFFASFLPSGSISWLYYADRVSFFLVGVFGVALATVILPMLANFHVSRNANQFSASLDWALRWLLIISLPAALGLMILSGPVVITLFGHGKFTLTDIAMTQKAVIAFSLGLPAFMGVKVLATAFYAKQELNKPVRIAVVATVLHISLNSLLLFPLAHVGVAIATSIAAMSNALLLYWMLIKSSIYKPLPESRQFLVQLVFSNMIMTLGLLMLLPNKALWIQWHWGQQVMHLLLLVAGGALIYGSSLWLSGLKIKRLFCQPNLST